MTRIRIVEAVKEGNIVHIRPGEPVSRVDIWKRGSFRGSDLHISRVPVSEKGVSDESFIQGLVSLGLIEEKNWIPIRDGDLLSIVDVDTDFEEFQCQFVEVLESDPVEIV